MSVLPKFKPAWIKTDIWKQMIDNWNTPTWKAKSKRNKRIRSKPTGGKHTLASQSYATAKRKAVKDVTHPL
ncbi:putative transposase, Ptta/En/Spm, plant [Helianthus anomalus]